MNDEDSEEGFEKQQAGGVERVKNQIEQNLHEPFVVDPGLALGGKGKGIGIMHPALLPDVLSKADMPPQIRVCRDVGKLGEGERVHQEADH